MNVVLAGLERVIWLAADSPRMWLALGPAMFESLVSGLRGKDESMGDKCSLPSAGSSVYAAASGGCICTWEGIRLPALGLSEYEIARGVGGKSLRCGICPLDVLLSVTPLGSMIWGLFERWCTGE